MITKEQVGRAMGYAQYRNLLEHLMAQDKTTGPNQSETYLGYAKLNIQRMSRLDKTIVLNDDIKTAIKKISIPYIWLTLTEGWCSDAAQNLPLLAAIEQHSPHISLKLLLRDENLDVMDQYLTGTSRSIPKLICMEKETLKEIFTWGPRPKPAQDLMLELKKNNTPSAERSLQIQKWYNTDKTQTLQNEFLQLIQTFLK